MRGFVFICMITLSLNHGCSTNHESTIITEQAPSIIYADDGSTILSLYSNVGKKGPNLAPYFCASLEKDLAYIFSQKNEKGTFKYHKKDGTPYNVYTDELKIYTSINPKMQEYAESAVRRHLTEDLQPAFSKNNAEVQSFPFSNTYNGKKVTSKTINNILERAQKSSIRYQTMIKVGVPEQNIQANFDVPAQMKLFSWGGEIDTVLTPNDSILYAKNYIRSSVLSIEPSTGHIKAWVGGIDFDHFPNDCIRESKRQMGSIIKPFIYATAMSMGVIKPCTELSNSSYCVDPCDSNGKRWCPTGTMSGTYKTSFAQSSGIPTVSVMSRMGACTGPQTIAKLLESMGFEIPENQVVPSMCLGTPDASLFEIVAANAMFVNNGVYISPQTVIRIEDRNGNEIYSAKTVAKPVLNATVAFEVLQLMKGVVQFGTATSLRGNRKWGGIKHPTAAKTGTTQGNSDGWFIGMTPDLVTGIWTGGEDKQIRFRSILWGQGARMCLPIYGYYMQSVYADQNMKISTDDFTPPSSYDPKLFECLDN